MYEKAWNPSSSHTNILPNLPQALAPIWKEASVLLQASITDISNCRRALDEQDDAACKQYCEASNMLTLEAATTLAARVSPKGRVVLLPRPPRFDDLRRLSEYANQDLKVQYLALPAITRKKLMLVNHRIKVDTDQEKRDIFGDFESNDRVHFRGPAGQRALSGSVANAILEAFRSTPTASRIASPQPLIRNMFAPLEENC